MTEVIDRAADIPADVHVDSVVQRRDAFDRLHLDILYAGAGPAAVFELQGAALAEVDLGELLAGDTDRQLIVDGAFLPEIEGAIDVGEEMIDNRVSLFLRQWGSEWLRAANEWSGQQGQNQTAISCHRPCFGGEDQAHEEQDDREGCPGGAGHINGRNGRGEKFIGFVPPFKAELVGRKGEAGGARGLEDRDRAVTDTRTLLLDALSRLDALDQPSDLDLGQEQPPEHAADEMWPAR